MPVFILLFATTYYLMDHANATTFAEPLTRIDSMCFSATVFHLCGVAPIPPSSGKSNRRRLDRGGGRQANSALWRIVMVRNAHVPDTTAYFERKVKEGRSKRDFIRLLKHYVARKLERYLPRG